VQGELVVQLEKSGYRVWHVVPNEPPVALCMCRPAHVNEQEARECREATIRTEDLVSD
jgi:hypothetical protein